MTPRSRSVPDWATQPRSAMPPTNTVGVPLLGSSTMKFSSCNRPQTGDLALDAVLALPTTPGAVAHSALRGLAVPHGQQQLERALEEEIHAFN